MKKQLHFVLTAFLMVTLSVAILSGCKSKQKATTIADQGEKELALPCFEDQYMTSDGILRANAIGESMDQMTSKKKALTEARAELAAQINTLVKTVTDNYVKSGEFDNKEELLERYEGLTREVVKQELNGTKTICQKMTQTASGNYKTYIAIELAGSELLSAINNRVSNDEMLKIDYNYEKYKKTFEEEMNKLDD